MKATMQTLLRPIALGLLLASPFAITTVKAENLQQIFDLASKNDPEIRGVRHTFSATHTLLDQGRSTLFPTMTASAAESRDTSGTAGAPPAGSRTPEHSFSNGFTGLGGMEITANSQVAQSWTAVGSGILSPNNRNEPVPQAQKRGATP
mgnify:CR=1 FL=1